MSICGFVFVDENNDPIPEKNRKIPMEEGVISGQEALKKASEVGWYYTVMWNKLFKRELFSEIRFPKGKVYEDLFISHLLLERCRTVACISDTEYYYSQRSGSIIQSKTGRSDLHAAEAFLDRACFFHERGLQRGVGTAYLKSAMYLADACWKCRKQPALQAELNETVRRFRQNYRFRETCSYKGKLQLAIVFRSPVLYHLVFKNYLRKRVRQIKGSITKISVTRRSR